MNTRVHVVMGGPSAEHEVSLCSGLEVLNHLDPRVYCVKPVVVSHDKAFFYGDTGTTTFTIDDLRNPAASGAFAGPLPAASSAALWGDCDVAFLALHGSFGEDGVIQGFLDTIGIPYTGSGVYASAVAMEKIASKFLFIQNGLAVPPYSIYGKDNPDVTIESIGKKHGFPCFVKCPQSGSSRLMGRADDRASLAKLIAELESCSDRILIETAVHGIEFSCGVLEKSDGRLVALPPIEIRPVRSQFFDYTAKYSKGESEEIVPAPRPPALLRRIEEIALHVHRIIGCSGLSRTDMIYSGDTLYVLETNTLPGLTSNSLLPKAFMASGGTFGGLLDCMIQTALMKRAH